MRNEDQTPLLRRWRRDHTALYDAVAQLVYTLFVYGWALAIYPLGRDYELLATGGQDQPWLSATVLRWEVASFGAHPVLYHVVNVALLYASMLLLYRLTNEVIKGPWWLGNWAAVLLMANPVHSESMLNLAGCVDLLPCVAALAALVAYVSTVASPMAWKKALAIALFALAVLLFPSNTFLLAVPALYEVLIVEPPRKGGRRLLPLALVTLIALVWRVPMFAHRGFSLARAWAPLYFIFYPIGFLPESAQQFHARAWLGWLAAAAVAFILVLILRRARSPIILFGLLAMLAVRLFPGDRLIDPVHLVGGGQLLLASALFSIALTALFYRMMRHARWRPSLIAATTFIALVLFGLQIHSNLAWKRGGEEVRTFQARALALRGEPVGVLPDYRYYQTAPVDLSDSIAYDSVFSHKVSHVSLLPLHRLDKEPPDFTILSRSPEEAVLEIDRECLKRAAPWPYELAHAGGVLQHDGVTIEVLPPAEPAAPRQRLRIRVTEGRLPQHTLPVEQAE